MKNLKAYILPIILAQLLITGCAVEPRPIIYGDDTCHFCRMTIIDKQHAAEIVTQKGKVYKFDAVECMLNHANDADQRSMAFFLVNGYTEPGKLVDAAGATYLISEGIPSPMGAFLTAFEDINDAQKAQQKYGGQLFAWNEIMAHFKN
jgi:copper chaperone NosL